MGAAGGGEGTHPTHRPRQSRKDEVSPWGGSLEGHSQEQGIPRAPSWGPTQALWSLKLRAFGALEARPVPLCSSRLDCRPQVLRLLAKMAALAVVRSDL